MYVSCNPLCVLQVAFSLQVSVQKRFRQCMDIVSVTTVLFYCNRANSDTLVTNGNKLTILHSNKIMLQ